MIKEWKALACHKCAAKDFVPVYNLRFQQGLGTSPSPVGYYCLGCHERLDQEKAVLAEKRRVAQEQIRDIEAAIG